MPIYLKTSTAANSWRKATNLYLKTSTATNSWRKIVSAYIKTNDGWRSLFSSVVFPSIEQQVVIGSTGGTNAQSTIMSDGSPVTLVGTKYHWNDADGFTYVWQKSSNNINWSNIGTAQSTTNPASGSSSTITKQLSASDFTSGSDMYFRFVFSATNSTYGTSSDSTSSSLLISYYGTPTPQPGSPSITGSTVVGSTASGNIGTWTNSPTAYDYRVYYTSGLSSYPLTYAGIKSVTNKTLSGYSALLTTSANHNYKVDDTVVISSMDALFNGSSTISYASGNVIGFTLTPPATYSDTSSYSSGSFVNFSGNAYRAVSALPSGSNFSLTAAYSVGNNMSFVGHRYRCLIALSASTAWTDAGTGYSVGDNVYYNSNRYRANSSLSGVSPFNGGTLYSAGAIVYSGSNRYQSNLNNNIGNSVTNTTWWSNLGSFAPGSNSMWTSVMPTNLSYWEDIDPGNTSYWTFQSFSNAATSGTVTAPNYYEGTVYSSTSIPIGIPTYAYKENIDLRGSTSSATGAVLNFGVKAYNQATLNPSEYLGTAFIYGVPVISIGSITPSSTSASVPFTSSYLASYLLNLYTQPSITNVTGGTSTVTYFAQNTFTSGQQVVISGINPSQYNGTRTIQSATSTSFTVSANITGDYVSGGTAKVTVSGYPLTVSSNASPRSITGLSESTQYYLEMTPSNNGSTGTMQTATFTTLAQPTISNISLVNTKAPNAATSSSFSSNSSNVGTITWTNGLNSSSAWLKSVTGSGSLSTQSDPGSLNTSGTFSIISTGTADATVSAINKGKSVYVTWSQTKAASYLISYRIGTAPLDVILGNSTASNPEILIYGPVTGTASEITINSVTVYNLPDQTGPSAILSSGSKLTPTNAQTDTLFSGSVTYTVPQVAPSGGTASVDPTTGTAGTTTFTASTSGWSGTTPITYTYSWQWMNSSFQWNAVATGTTFTPTLAQNASAIAWRVVVTATNAVGSATASASFTVNNPQYTVTYNANGGTVSPTSATVTAGSSVTLPSPSRSGFTFNGWYTAASGGSFLGFGGTSYTPSSSITIFAQWTAIQYTVTWNANGGTVSPTSNTVNAGNSVTAPTPTRSGFTFSTWRNPLSGGDPIFIAAGGSYTPTTNITFYAIWVAVANPNVTQITALGLGNTAAPYIRFTFTSTDAASLSIMLYRSATSSTGPWTPLSARSVQSTTGTFSIDFSSRTGTTSNWYYVDVIPYSGANASGTAGTTRTSRVKRGTETTTTTVYP